MEWYYKSVYWKSKLLKINILGVELHNMDPNQFLISTMKRPGPFLCTLSSLLVTAVADVRRT